MADGFYRAMKALAGDENLSYGEKWVRVVQAHYLAFEGRNPTTSEIAKALGTERRGINKILARLAGREQKAPVGGNKRPWWAGTKGPKTGTKGPPFHSLLDIETKGERHTAPSPSAALDGKKEKTDGLDAVVARAGEGGGFLAMLALKARAGGGKWPLVRWIGQVEEDEAARRYRRADLEAFVASRTAITESPWRLAESVRRHAQAARAAAFRERLRRIRAEGLVRAIRPDGEARVMYVEPDRPLLVIERRIPPPAGTSYGPQVKRWDVMTPADLAAWTFQPDQPRLFE